MKAREVRKERGKREEMERDEAERLPRRNR